MISSETSKINALITEGAKRIISDKRFLELEIMRWKKLESDDKPTTRGWQVAGERYFNNDHDILKRKRTAIGKGGRLVELENVPNNQIVDNQYAKAVTQKVNYLVGKPFTIASDDNAYAEHLHYYFDKKFKRTLKNILTDSLNQGVGWVYIYIDDTGDLAFKRIESYEIKPFWKDSEHQELEMAVRLYEIEAYKDNEIIEIVEKVEVFTENGIDRYYFDSGTLRPDDPPHLNYFQVKKKDVSTGEEVTADYNWLKIPLVCFKYNNNEIPLIKMVKSLQDGINLMISDFENRMQEDSRNTILILENYDGEDLGSFRSKLSQYGAVKVRSDKEMSGGVRTLTLEFSAENYQAILRILKEALIENAKSYDAKDDRLSGVPNQMNIQSMYNDIDLDANDMETEIQAAFSEMTFFINQHLINSGKGDYTKQEFTVTFNRSTLVNTGEKIEQCKNSIELISTETILKNHPFVDNVDAELKRLEKQKKAEMDSYGTWPLEQQVNTNETG